MRKQNVYYDDLIVGMCCELWSSQSSKNGFQDYMKSIGKLGDKINYQDFHDRKLSVFDTKE